MKYPNTEQGIGVSTRRTVPDFGLTRRAFKFAKTFAKQPKLGVGECARLSGYGARGARARGNELLRDSRVIKAIIFFSARALNDAIFEARRNLASLAVKEGRLWNDWDRNSINRLTLTLKSLETHMERIEKLYIRERT